ncbi:MAG: hypothetical protein A2X49_11910 [Lentisphaerae bacterium GWF2_52_8]|nr:MAG: hypothetical protein A2X49_11910 [Lentisphaerae bacterium GWF2_52_8]
MKHHVFFIALLGLASLALNSAFAADPANIEYAGILWGLRQTAGPVDPGPNTFSNAIDQVWIDDLGRLHLTITQRGGVWTASELMAKKDAGYGTYQFDIDGSVRNLDPNIVFGFFTWDRAPELYNREVDIELSRWGMANGLPGWFTVQPYDKAGNQYSFDLPAASFYRFSMRWEAKSISFTCEADGKPVASWNYMGAVPDPGRARLRINLWLFRGKAPSTQGPHVVILSNFSYAPMK